MSIPFKGVINVDVRDSTPDWTPYDGAQGAGGRAERPDRPLRRHRAGRLVALRRPHQHADAAEAGRQRADVLAVAHHRPLLADPLDLPHRPQPPPERVQLHHRRLRRLPGRQRPHPRLLRSAGAGDAGQRLQHLLAGQEPQRAGGPAHPRRPEDRLAAQPGLGPLLRLPRRRDEPVLPVADVRQPHRRAAIPAGGRLSPLPGPGRPGHPDAEGRAADQPLAPVLHVVLPRRQPRAAPGAAGVGRQVQGQVRRRLRGLPGVGPAAHDREGAAAGGHPADPDQPAGRGQPEPRRRGAPLGRAQRRREEALRPHGRGLRRLLRVHRRTRWGASSSTWRTPGSSRTPSSSTPPTTAPPARAARTARSTRTSSSTAGRTRSKTIWR